MVYQFLLLSLSFLILFFGAKWTLDSAEKIGHYFNLPALMIGLLIIGFGTSLPELFVCHLAVRDGHEGIALGNIIGSNIANTFLILGAIGLLIPMQFDLKIRKQLYWHLGATMALVLIILKKSLDYQTLGFLSLFFSIYLYMVFSGQRKKERDKTQSIGYRDVIILVVGLIFLYFGGRIMVSTGSNIAISIGMSEYVVSAIFVAFGTSFPELATALLAWRKKKNLDLITGNIIGSNIFNIVFVMGTLGFYQIPISRDYLAELILLSFAAVILLIFSLCKKTFFRFSGGCFLCLYGVMVYFWIID